MTSYKTYYKLNMPHYQPPGYVFFVTTRLAGSLPKSVVINLQSEYKVELKRIVSVINRKSKRALYEQIKLDYFKKFDGLLHDYNKSPDWLKLNEVASVVKDSFHYGDKKSYDLYAYCIMPNHIHLILKPYEIKKHSSTNTDNIVSKVFNSRNRVSCYILTNIMQNIKKFTARKCNRVLGRSGQFWHHESYDHVIRSNEELVRITEYILNNPVKAGLVEDPYEWEWNYYNPEFYV